MKLPLLFLVFGLIGLGRACSHSEDAGGSIGDEFASSARGTSDLAPLATPGDSTLTEAEPSVDEDDLAVGNAVGAE